MAEVVNTPDFQQQFFDLNGDPLANGRLAFFENNTDIPVSVYTAGGSVELGSELVLDSSGFPDTQFALEAGKSYTVKAFDSDNVLLWTRNDVFGGGDGGGVSGDYIPMEGTTADDPVRGPIVWKNENGDTTVNANQIRTSNTSSEFTTINPGTVHLYGPTSQATLWKNELRLISTWTGQEGTASLKNNFLRYTNKDGTLDSYVTPSSFELINTADTGVKITSLKQPGEAIESSCIDLTASGGANRLRLKCNENSIGYSEISSRKTLRIDSLEHVYLSGTHASVFATGNTGRTDLLLGSEHGDVMVLTDGGTLTLSGTKFDFGQRLGIYADRIIDAANINPLNPNDHGLITEAAAVALAGGGMTNPMTDEGDMIIGGASGAPTRLPNGTSGQLLTMGATGVPEWSDKPAACQENYSIIDSTGLYAADSYINQILTSKVIANVDRTYSQLGVGLKKGQTGGTGRFALAIYDVSKNLVARTPLFQITEVYQGEVYWVDTETTFRLNAGDEYFFAFWAEEYPGSNTIQFLGHLQVSTFDQNLVGILYGQSGLSEMPLSLGTLSYGQMCPYMAVR